MTISSVSVANSGRSGTAGHDPGGTQSSSSASDDPLMCLCPLQRCRPRRESRRRSATDRGKCTVPVPSAMMQEVVYEVDREEEVSQSDAEPVMNRNIPAQNADDVAEFVFAMVLNSARNSFDGTSGMITDAPSHDERVIAARYEFMNACDEEVSDEDGCQSRSMTIKATNTILMDQVWINCAASEIVFQPSTQTPATRCMTSVIAVREELNLHLILPRDVTDDSQHVTLHVPFDSGDQGFHQRGSAHEDAEGCHTDQQGVSGGRDA